MKPCQATNMVRNMKTPASTTTGVGIGQCMCPTGLEFHDKKAKLCRKPCSHTPPEIRDPKLGNTCRRKCDGENKANGLIYVHQEELHLYRSPVVGAPPPKVGCQCPRTTTTGAVGL